MSDAATNATSARLNAALAGRYAIEREAGAGGMATVYLARDVKHDRKVALKVLHPDLAAALGAERFLAEIRTTANLQHPHILPLHDSGEADGFLFYVMPFVEGETLRGRLERERQLPLDDALRITKEVLSALDYAHRRGVIHRDIKPENVLLHDGSALVADFGIALAVTAAGGQRMTQTGLSLGTPQYMSPEQAMGERNLDARADVYAAGVVLYEMLTGEPPFTGATVQAIVAKVMTERPTPPSTVRDTVPAHLEAATLKALAKLPADRFATAAQFAAALDARGAETAVAGRTAARPRPLVRRLAPWLVAVAALLVGLAAGRALGPAPAGAVRYTQTTFGGLAIRRARFAPDGKTLVFSATPAASQERGPVALFVVRPDYPEPQPLAQEPLHLLAVSSRGELAVLTRPVGMSFNEYSGTLARMPAGGGAPREMVEGVHDADWSPDGSQLAVIRRVAGKDRLEYPLGTVLVEVTGWLTDPRFSPDGRSIAFVDHPRPGDDRGTLGIVDLAGRRTTPDATEYAKVSRVAWSRDGGEVFVSVKVPTEHQAVVLGVTRGGRVRQALNGAGDLLVQDVAPDGRWLVLREEFTVELYAHAAGDSAPRRAGWLDQPFRPAISPDGRLVAFGESSTESGVNYSAIMRSTDGGKAVRLGEGSPAAFSHDGRSVLAIVPSRPVRLVIYPTGAGTERTVPTGDLDAIGQAGWGPGDSSVWYCGTTKTTPRACFTRALAGGAPTPADPGMIGPSPDGRLIVAVSRGPGAMLATATGDTLRAVPSLAPGDRIARWSPDGRALWVVTRPTNAVDAVDITTGVRRPLLPAVATSDGRPRMGAITLVLADDPRSWAYTVSRYASELFAVEGVR